ncbi:FtsK/SpoIIIE domain-containing protein [Arthrobacter sp. ISL-69]|uniref:FtsK/SpoIIIE domain-containing protein n=1 Tax=Arthrobacter sp. ISL-69 TaxID=2819113 RepID=UPI001BE4F8B7|nr:FtsK/SpoIIIE domain-containing protein [Arthrobacter sp. ISL-69]MBT2536668.1 FHA domain-containing protein [Arthrobacter sp. ISL-69]
MTLHCTLVRGPDAGSPGPPLELTIAAGHGAAGHLVQQAIAEQYGAGELTVRGLPLAGLAVGVPPFVTGAVIVDGVGGHAADTGNATDAGLLIAVHSGPAAGTVLPLRRGTYRIGRSGTEIALPDAALSREHARLDVTDTAITITDLGSANGTIVDGKRVAHSAVSANSLISCGNSTLSITFGPRPAGQLAEWEAAGSSVTEPLRVPHRAEGGNRVILFLTAALPLLIGVGLAVITGMWMFLAFTAVSAVSVLVPMLAGRRQRCRLKASVAAAVEEDKERRRRSAPSAAALVLRGQAEPAVGTGGTVAPDDLGLRLGLADQQANVRLDPADPDFDAPAAGRMPVILHLPDRTFVRGPRQDVAGLIRFMVMQLTSYRNAARTRILLQGRPESLPLTSRYLTPVSLLSNARKTSDLLERGIDRSRERGVLILIDDVDGAPGISGMTATAINRGWHVLDCTRGGSAEAGTVIELGGNMARLCAGNSTQDFLPDLVPERVFDRYCRDMAPALERSPATPSVVPLSCSLADVLPASAADTSVRWLGGRGTRGLAVPIGMSAQGPRMLDLESDGPHLLVAGTTGSGKSELLRSLAAGLALSFPPDVVNLLFFDFKGGSGLGPLTGLPHCVGMLTDLTRDELDRSLISLRAEIRRREELLSAVQAPDLAGYRAAGAAAGPLPHLVLIIDEFRMLVEDAPEALTELMRIAAIGRSLGLHLIMATQRPQGALTADIRANVTTSIALRVQSEMESFDIINSRVAAGIDVATPGRAYLARGSEDPVEFQTASLAGAAADPTASGVRVCLAAEALREAPEGPGQPNPDLQPSPAQAAAPLIESLVELWNGMGGTPPHRPVAGPLPRAVSRPGTATPDRTAVLPTSEPLGVNTEGDPSPCVWSVQLGLADEPQRQRISRLTWQPSGHGHLAVVGGPGSGADDAVALALQQLIEHVEESHLYILDAGNSFSASRAEPRVGAVAGLHELRRAVRILERIALEMSLRLSQRVEEQATPLVLVLTGWGSWVSAFRAGPLAWAEDLVQDIVRDGTRAGVTVLISGDRDVVTARYFAAVPNRAFFPNGSTEESRLAWPRIPDVARVRGRAVVFGPLTGSPGSVAQFYAPAAGTAAKTATVKEPAARPFRIEALPTRLSVSDVQERTARLAASPLSADAATGSGTKHRTIVIGIGGDELLPATVRLPPGCVLPVLGGPATGKSSLLAAIPQLNPHVPAWLFPGTDDAADNYWAGLRLSADAGALSRDAVLVVDDADMLTPEATRHLMDLHSLGWTVLLTAGFSPTLVQRVPLAAHARGHGNGILIAPRNIMDGDFFGVRFEVDPNPPPGRAVLISEGRATPVHLAAGSSPGVTGRGAPHRHARRS